MITVMQDVCCFAMICMCCVTEAHHTCKIAACKHTALCVQESLHACKSHKMSESPQAAVYQTHRAVLIQLPDGEAPCTEREQLLELAGVGGVTEGGIGLAVHCSSAHRIGRLA